MFEGIAIANALRSHPATVTTQVDGIAASIASVIALAGDRLVMMPHSQLMIHEASGMCFGDAADMAQMAALLERQSDNLADVYAARAGGTREEWRALMQAETWYLADEAVAVGLADEVVQPTRGPSVAPIVPTAPDEDVDEARMAAHWDLSVFRYAGREQAPAPAPVAAVSIDLNIEDTPEIADGLTEIVRAAVTPPASTAAPVAPASDQEPTAAAEPAAPDPAPLPAEPDLWAALTASLRQPAPDPWGALVSHLIENPASSSAATDA